jgi:hypothetical protein
MIVLLLNYLDYSIKTDESKIYLYAVCSDRFVGYGKIVFKKVKNIAKNA